MKLTIENSWWNEGGLWQDPDLKKVKSSQIHYRPEIWSSQELKPGTLFTLRGPRRCGKTVTLKLLVARLIEEQSVPPRSIYWTAFDRVRTLDEMEKHLEEILKNSPRYLFIDEITSLVGWQKVMKYFVDTGQFAKTTTILTGSSSFDLKKASERLAGRKGALSHTDRVLLPMSYATFVTQMQKPHNRLSDYLRVGGFPFRVNEFVESKGQMPSSQGLAIFDDVYFYEVNRRKLDRNIALDVLCRLSEVKNHALSYEAFVKPLSIAKETARKYLNLLGDAFLLATIYSYDVGRNRISIKKDKKFVWIDPALSFLAKETHQGEEADEPCRAEWVLGVELLKRFEARLWEGVSAPRNVFTWKSSGGNEIDYLVIDRSQKHLMPFEIKFQSSISDWDFQVMERAFKKGVLITKDVEKKREKATAIPLEQYLLKPIAD